MKILKGALPLVVTITVVWAAEDKHKKTEDKLKKNGKRQIGFGLEAIPGVAFHAPLADDALLIAQTTAHGGIGGYGLVRPIGLIQADNTGGFASQGFNPFQGGYGLYAPQSLVAAPILDVQQAPKTHQLDGGWKGIDHGHGSVKHGHEIAQSLVSKPLAPYQDGIFEVALPVVPQFDFEKARNALYSPNALVPMYNGFDTPTKGLGPVYNLQQFTNLQQAALPKDYNFASLHGNQGIQVSPAYHHTPGHLGQNHKGHGSISHGHQLASQGHQLAKKVQIPSRHGGFIGSHGPKVHHEKARLYSHQKETAHQGSHSFVPSAPSRTNYYLPAPSRQSSYAPSALSRPVAAFSDHATHDSTSYSTSYSTDFNAPQQTSYSPDFNPLAGLGSSEHSDFSRTNGHGGPYSGEKKATSFQSFIIHNYKPHPNTHKTKYDSLESDENYSGSNYNSAQAVSGEKHF